MLSILIIVSWNGYLAVTRRVGFDSQYSNQAKDYFYYNVALWQYKADLKKYV